MAIYKGLDKLDPNFRAKLEKFLAANPHVEIVESWRSYARQLWLYAQGRTRDGRIVTWTLKSMHLLGKAADLKFKGDIPYPRDWTKWQKLSDSAEKFGIDSGFSLGWGKDYTHFQDNPNIMAIPSWGEKTAQEMQDAGIDTDPGTKLKDMPLFQIIMVVKKYVSWMWSIKK